jgi:hypothetical protein
LLVTAGTASTGFVGFGGFSGSPDCQKKSGTVCTNVLHKIFQNLLNI